MSFKKFYQNIPAKITTSYYQASVKILIVDQLQCIKLVAKCLPRLLGVSARKFRPPADVRARLVHVDCKLYANDGKESLLKMQLLW